MANPAFLPEITNGEYAIECDRRDGAGYREFLPGIRGKYFAERAIDGLLTSRTDWSFRIVCITPDVRNEGVYSDGWGY